MADTDFMDDIKLEFEHCIELGRLVETMINDADREGVFIPELAKLALWIAHKIKNYQSSRTG